MPNVQELAKKTITFVPPRYLRPDQQDPPLLNINSTSSFSSIHVPLIDFNCLVSGDSMDSELDKLHSACKDWGFVQVSDQFNYSYKLWLLRLIDELFLLLIITNKTK